MKTIEASTVVNASPDVVWSVITDLPSYGEWNPFITAIDGDLQVGGQLRATFSLPGRKPTTFTPRVTLFEPGRRLRWLGRLPVPRLFDGEHELAVKSRDGETVFVQIEHFRGLLVPLMGKLLASTEEAFGAMNAALAARAQTVAGRGPGKK